MNRMKKGMILACCAAAAVLFAGCGGSADKSAAGEAPKGEINLYTSQPEADAQKLVAAFNQKYPDVKV